MLFYHIILICQYNIIGLLKIAFALFSDQTLPISDLFSLQKNAEKI